VGKKKAPHFRARLSLSYPTRSEGFLLNNKSSKNRLFNKINIDFMPNTPYELLKTSRIHL